MGPSWVEISRPNCWILAAAQALSSAGLADDCTLQRCVCPCAGAPAGLVWGTCWLVLLQLLWTFQCHWSCLSVTCSPAGVLLCHWLSPWSPGSESHQLKGQKPVSDPFLTVSTAPGQSRTLILVTLELIILESAYAILLLPVCPV